MAHAEFIFSPSFIDAANAPELAAGRHAQDFNIRQSDWMGQMLLERAESGRTQFHFRTSDNLPPMQAEMVCHRSWVVVRLVGEAWLPPLMEIQKIKQEEANS